VATLLDVLLDANLLQEVAEERFRFHDLVRLHARQKADTVDPAPVRDRALLALVEWQHAAAVRADLAVTPYRRRLPYAYRTSPPDLPSFAGRGGALSWLERERANLVAAGRAALDHGWAELAWHLCDVMWPLLLYLKLPVHRLDLDTRGVEAARQWGDPMAESRMLRRLGRTRTTLGDYDLAERHLRAAIARSEQAGDLQGGVESREMLAALYRDSAREAAALEVFLDVLDGRRRLGDDRGTGLTLINVGTLLSRLGRAGEATGLLREAVTLLEPLAGTDPYNGLRAKLGLADAFLRTDDVTGAEQLAAEAIEGMRAIGSSFGEADALTLLAKVAERRGHTDRAHELRSLARAIHESLGSARAAEPPGPAAAPQKVEEGGDGVD
jgi:tetratricopeptide (TPR) repeat protein